MSELALLVASITLLSFLVSCQSTGANAGAEVSTREVAYEATDGTKLRGFLARPVGAERRPAVLVIHEWWGHNDYVRGRARQLAELGYVALAVDMYGDGKTADHPKDAQAFMEEVMGGDGVMEARFRAALDVLRAEDGVDPQRLAAIGYCMGGAVGLQMARAGADLRGVVSFHGSLGTTARAAPGAVKPKLLVLTGADDPFVPAEQVAAFRDEMAAADADCEIVEYPGVVHAFTNPGATAKGEKFELPLRYDAEADADSWRRMTEFFAKIF